MGNGAQRRGQRYGQAMEAQRAVDVVVRDATPSDAPAVAHLGAEGFSESYRTILSPKVIVAATSRSTRRRPLKRPSAAVLRQGAEFLVAEAGGALVGFVDYDSEGKEPELHRIYVHLEATGGEIGTALLRALHARLTGHHTYILKVLAENEGAIRSTSGTALSLSARPTP
jgi:ribosomal protein S18 acetylase RimI-like enzyme